MRRTLSVVGSIVLLAALGACGNSTAAPAPAPTTSPTATISGTGGSGGTSGGISPARCAQNKAAGTITYLTGYHYQASASILEVLAAAKLGYYSQECLNVKIEPGNGDTAQQAKLLAAGKAQISGIAEQDLIQTNLSGAGITGVSSYSNTGLDVLMTNPSITDLKQLDGQTLGYKGYMPIAIEAMLAKAGVDYNSLKKVVVGYDPTVLPRGQVQGLTGFLSNEPLLLKAAGDKVKVWQPSSYGIPSSLGSFAINTSFGQAYPSAVEDFLRATFLAFDYCGLPSDVSACIAIEHGYAGATDDADHEKGVWVAEHDAAVKAPTPTGFGTVDLKNVGKLAALISTYAGQKVSAAQAESYFNNSYVKSIFNNGVLVWPAP